MSILKALKEKVEFLKGFDSEISTRKQGLEKKSKGIILEDAQTLLNKYKAQQEVEADVKILEELKGQFLKPNVLGDLAAELLEETKFAYDELANLREACEQAKKNYTNTLKELNEKHYSLMKEIQAKKSEYENVAIELGFEYAETKSKLHIPENYVSYAECTSKEPIYLDC